MILIFSITCFRKGFCHGENFLQSDVNSNLFVGMDNGLDFNNGTSVM